VEEAKLLSKLVVSPFSSVMSRRYEELLVLPMRLKILHHLDEYETNALSDLSVHGRFPRELLLFTFQLSNHLEHL